MSSGTIGTLAQDNIMLQSLLQLRTQANDLQQQVATGLKSPNYSGLGPGAASQVANLQASVSQNQAYLDTNSTVQQRIQEQNTVLTSIESAAQMTSCGRGSDFPPNPPPTSGLMTRIRCIGIPSTSWRVRWR